MSMKKEGNYLNQLNMKGATKGAFADINCLKIRPEGFHSNFKDAGHFVREIAVKVNWP